MSATFVAPTSLDDVLAALASGATALAGGTDLVVGHRQGKKPLPAAVVALDRIPALRGISGGDAGMTIGAFTTHDDALRHDRIRSEFTAIADASSIVGSEATRSTGTLGGNLMNASPAADTLGPLLCLGGVAVLRSVGEERRLPIGDLLVGPGRTNARSNELLTAIELPSPAAHTGSSYVRLEYRRHMEIAVVGATAVVTLAVDGSIAAACIAITAVAPTIRRVPEAEAALVGSAGDLAAANAAGALAAAAATPISDVRGTADYRRAMVAVITRRAIVAAVARARGEHVAIPASDSTFGAQS